MTEFTPVTEFKLLNEQLRVAHEAFMVRLRADAPALLNDYVALAGLTQRVVFGALCLESSEQPNTSCKR